MLLVLVLVLLIKRQGETDRNKAVILVLDLSVVLESKGETDKILV